MTENLEKETENDLILRGWNEFWKEYKGITLTEAEKRIFERTQEVFPWEFNPDSKERVRMNYY